MTAIKTALRASVSALKKVAPLLTLRNASIVLGLLSAFGVVAPDTATAIRNKVLEPIGIVTGHQGDLVSLGG